MRVSYTQKLPNCASLEKDNEGKEGVREDGIGREREKERVQKKEGGAVLPALLRISG